MLDIHVQTMQRLHGTFYATHNSVTDGTSAKTSTGNDVRALSERTLTCHDARSGEQASSAKCTGAERNVFESQQNVTTKLSNHANNCVKKLRGLQVR